MRILHTNMQRDWGDQPFRILTEALGARKAGHDVAFAVPRDSVLAVKAKLAGMEVWPGFEFVPPLQFWTFMPDLIRLRDQVRKWEPDIIHTHGSQDTWLVMTLKYFSRGRFPPIIRTKHNIFEWKTHNANIWLYKGVDAFISLNRQIEGQIAAFPGIGSKPRVIIPSVPDVATLTASQPSIRKELPELRPGAFLWGSIGQLRHEKGFDVLLKAIARVREKRRDCHLVIVGEGSERAELDRLAEKLKLGPDALTFLGFREDIPAVLQSLDGYVLPSRAEGLAGAVLDAQAVGLPVVATNVGAIADAIQHDVTGLLVAPESDIAMAEAMLYVMDNPEERTRLRAAARLHIERNFNERKLVQSTLDFYVSIFRLYNEGKVGLPT